MGRSSLRYLGLILLAAANLATAAGPGDYYATETPIPAAMPEESSGAGGSDPAVYEIDDGNEYVADDSGSLGEPEVDPVSYFDEPGEFYEQAAAYHQDPYAGSVNQCATGVCQDNCDCMYCNRSRRLYGRAEYLQYWVRGFDTPPLVTVGPPGATQNTAGVLPDASIVVGNERFDGDRRIGGRYTIGYWLDQCETSAIEASFLHFEHSSEFYRIGDINNNGPIIGRPFVDVTGGLPGVNAASLVSFPNVVAGQVDVSSSSRILGSELNWRQAMRNDDVRLDFIAGYRYFRLDEGLKIGEVTRDLTGQFPPDTRFFVDDSFSTDNQFHGGQIGLNWERHYRRFSLDLLGKLGIGNMNQRVRINGSTTVVDPIGGTTVVPGGGLLALDSNIGDYSRNRFSFIPEFGANLHFCLGKNCRLTAGYSLIYVTNVVRPGDQIDTRLDTNQFPPPVAPGVFPAFPFKETNVWLQGVNLGIEARF